MFVEVSDAVRESLVEVTPARRSGRAAVDARPGGPRVRLGVAAQPTCWTRSRARSTSSERSVFEDSIQYEDDAWAIT